MAYEFIDQMFERLLVVEGKTYKDAFQIITKERVVTIGDLGRVENAYQLFCKKHPEAKSYLFRAFVKDVVPKEYDICVKYFRWPKDVVKEDKK